MAKLKQRRLGCLRTMTGAQQFYAMQLPVHRCKNGLTFFDALVNSPKATHGPLSRRDHIKD
jgi:hypothetical protein